MAKIRDSAHEALNDFGDPFKENLNLNLTDPRIIQDNEIRPFLKQLFLKNYGYNIVTDGVPIVATVELVLTGPNSSIGLSEDGRIGASTAMKLDSSGRGPGFRRNFEDKKIKVLAHTFIDPIAQPKNDDDHIRMSALGEYHALEISDKDNKFDQIRVGSQIWVNFRGKSSSPLDGGPSGYIIGIQSDPDLLESVVDAVQASTSLFPGCKPDIQLAGPLKGNLVGRTEANPNIESPPIRKHKVRIKTGMFGNGTSATKTHFEEALRQSDNAYYYNIPGPAPGQENAFIWIGHLRNNGYLDLLDRPLSLGRETIIYAPMTINPYAPIELIYYFHDRGGFGHPWIHGPGTTIDEASFVPTEGNDFKEKIGPAIKDMIRDKRNFVLVIPEMSFSMGFGTLSGDYQRVNKMANGERVSVSTARGTTTMRTAIDVNARQSVKDYLIKLPASKIIEYSSGFLNVVSNEVAVENILQKTFLRERETVTFDGSYTGGKFGDFHAEVFQVISEHLGQQFVDNIVYSSITADGLGAVNLASIVRSMPFSYVHTSAESSFRSVDIKRINYIESGVSTANFSDSPSYSIYEDYLEPKTISPFPFEFNYIVEGGSSGGDMISGMKFFNKIGSEQIFLNNNSIEPGKGSERVVAPVRPGSEVTIALHTAPKTSDGTTTNKVLYALGIKPNYPESVDKTITTPETTISVVPSYSLVPDHAATATSGVSEGKANFYKQEKEKLVDELNLYENILLGYIAETSEEFCSTYAAYCTDFPVYDNVYAKSQEKITPLFFTYIRTLRKFYEFQILEEAELIIAKFKGKVQPLRDSYKSYKQEQDDLKTKIEKNTTQAFSEDFPNFSFSEAIGDGRTNYNYKTAYERLTSLRSNGPKARLALVSSDDAYNVFGGNPEETGQSVYKSIALRFGRLDALNSILQKIENELDKTLAMQTKPPVKGCAPQPISIRRITNINSAFIFNPDTVRSSKRGCPDTIDVVSSAAALYELIPWKPNVTSLKPSGTEKISKQETELHNVDSFQTKQFNYKARGSQNTVRIKKSPHIWSCIADRISEGWEAACNVSGYVPFMITDGIRGYKSDEIKSTGSDVTAYKTGVDIGAYGLSISVDAPLAGYKGNLEPVYSVFTGMWTPIFVEQYSEELYQLGVLKYNPTIFGALQDAGARYKDNAYQGFFEKDRRQAQNWDNAEDAYTSDSKRLDGYKKEMRKANGSIIVGPDANPVQWLLTFCERTGMRWGNSFFMRKRYRGQKSGLTIFGFDVRNDTPAFWNDQEQKRIAAIYDIDDVVARINAISIPQTTYDNHMHFQYYAGSPVVSWKDIEEIAKP